MSLTPRLLAVTIASVTLLAACNLPKDVSATDASVVGAAVTPPPSVPPVVTPAAAEISFILPPSPSAPGVLEKKFDPGPVQRISLVGLEKELVVGQLRSVTLFAYHTGDFKEVVSDTATLKFSADGVIGVEKDPLKFKALSVGSTTLTVKYSGMSADFKVTVLPKRLLSIAIEPGIVLVESLQTLRGYGVYNDDTREEVTSAVSFASSNTSLIAIETLDGQPMLRGLRPGTAVISGTYGGNTSTAIVEATLEELTSIAVTSSIPEVAIGTPLQLHATGTYKSGRVGEVTEFVAWTSDQPDILSVDDTIGEKGKVRANSIGGARIAAATGDLSATIDLSGISSSISGIEFAETALAVPIGLKGHIHVRGIPLDGVTVVDLTATVRMAVDTPTMADFGDEIDPPGTLHGIAGGHLSMTATYGPYTATIPVYIEPAALVSLVTTVDAASVAATQAGGYRCGVDHPAIYAVGHFSDGSERKISDVVTWTIAPATRATIAPNGTDQPATLSGTAEGLITIEASIVEPETGQTLTANNLTLSGIESSLVDFSVEADTGGTSQPIGLGAKYRAIGAFTCAVANPDVSMRMLWDSGNTNLLLVANIGASKGTLSTHGSLPDGSFSDVNVIATDTALGARTKTFTVRSRELTKVDLAAAPSAQGRVQIGATIALIATGSYTDLSVGDVTPTMSSWSADAPGLATVDASGQVTGVAEGLASFSGTLSTPYALGGVLVNGVKVNVATPCSAPGKIVDFYCYYLGAVGASCDATCGDAGRSFAAETISHSGSAGSAASCYNAVSAFGYTLNTFTNGNKVGSLTQSIGCAVLSNGIIPDTPVRFGSPATDSSSGVAAFRRVCACR